MKVYFANYVIHSTKFIDFFKSRFTAVAGVAQWIECGLQTKGSLVRFPVRAHAWVAGQVPSGGHMTGNHTLMFLSLFLSPFHSLK